MGLTMNAIADELAALWPLRWTTDHGWKLIVAWHKLVCPAAPMWRADPMLPNGKSLYETTADEIMDVLQWLSAFAELNAPDATVTIEPDGETTLQ